MRYRAFMRLVGCFVALLPFAAPAFAAEAVPRISGPIAYANLAVYLVHGRASGGPVPETLEQALAKGRVKVLETGDVNELVVENLSDGEVFIQAGDIVKGGRQDRVLSVDLLLPPHSGEVSIAAFCVEHGRWTSRGSEDARQFASARAAIPSPKAIRAMRDYAVASAPSVGSAAGSLNLAGTGEKQQEIWATVKETQERLARSVGASVAAPASPSSLQLSLENEKLVEAQAAYTGALQKAGESDDDIVGYAFAIDGKITGAEVYSSNALARAMWRKLLAANITAAIGEKNDAQSSPPQVNDVEAFLASPQSAPESERQLNDSVRLATRDGTFSLYAETRRADGDWVHRNYLVK